MTASCVRQTLLALGFVFGVVVTGVAQQPEPTPSDLTAPAAPEASPEETVPSAPSPPDLLPESSALPAPSATPPPSTFDLLPNPIAPQAFAPANGQGSAEQKYKDAVRFREIRTLTARDPYAISLVRYADHALTPEGRREYLRAYYHYTADRMRRLEPRLSKLISVYENARVGSVTQFNIKPTIPVYELEKKDAAKRAAKKVTTSATTSR